MDVSQQSGPQIEAPSTLPELKITPIFSLSLSYDIYRVSVGEASFIAKVFPPNKLPEYEQEKVILTQLDHKHIVKPIDFGHALVSKLASSVINAFILFPECVGGDLLNYVKANGSLSERVARFYTHQIVEALSYAHGSQILHPRLLAQNVLIDEKRNTLLCGWSNSIGYPKPTIKDILFAVGELIINLVTSRMPFISKDSKSDPFAKFLSEKYIHKLWEQIQKVVKKINKDFNFSVELRELLQGLLLGKIDSFKGILQSSWLKVPVSAGEVDQQLRAQESRAHQSKQTKKNKALMIQKEEKQIIKNNFSLGLHRKPSRALDIFQEQYENCKQSSNYDSLIEEKSKSDCRNYFKIFDSEIRFIVSHLRARLREVERDEQMLIDQLLLLKESEVVISGSSLKVNFTFGWNYDQLEEKSALCSLNHSIEVALRRDGSQVLGRLEVNEGLELNSAHVHQLNEWVMEALQHYG